MVGVMAEMAPQWAPAVADSLAVASAWNMYEVLHGLQGETEGECGMSFGIVALQKLAACLAASEWLGAVREGVVGI